MGGYSVMQWLQLIALAALVGAGGQGARVIVGLKKVNDAAGAASSGVGTSELIVLSRIAISLLIGAVAAGITAVTTIDPGALLSGEQIAGLAVAGYAGADFIEGFMSRAKGAPGMPAGQEAVGTGVPGNPDRSSEAGLGREPGEDEAVG